MIHLLSIEKRNPSKEKQEEYPFNTPVIRSLRQITFTKPITFFVGENGSGKSTLLEGIAAECNLPIIGSKNIQDDPTLEYAKELGRELKFSWRVNKHRGFFLRAEDFFGFTKRLNRLRAELGKEIKQFDEELKDGYGKSLAIGSIESQIESLTQRYGVDLSAQSHGESFLQLFKSRIKPGGLYLLDEPETPLSPTRQMSLLLLLDQMIKQDCQFIIATHSPILIAHPNATIIDFNNIPLKEKMYEEVDHVILTRRFVLDKEDYLKKLGITD